MKTCRSKNRSRRKSESGQAMIFMALALAIFLLGALAFAVDMGNLWFHRQAAQTTADAACTSAAMDMLYTANGGGPKGGFTPTAAFSCSGSTSAAPCDYAAKNMGYAASTLSAGTPGYDVALTFPATFGGLQSCTTGAGAPSICNDGSLPNNFVQVNVTDRAPLFFSGLISGKKTADVGAQATCGVVEANSPIPLLILNPTLPNTLNLSGNSSSITITGGPPRSIQVNSSSATAFSSNGNPTVDLSLGGNNNTGSDIGVTAQEALAASGIIYKPGSTGQWKDPVPAISDPFRSLPIPPKGPNGTVSVVPQGTDGCPAGAGSCYEYTPGYYSAGICVGKGGCTNKLYTSALFLPGVYYMDGNFSAESNSCLRPSTKPVTPNIGGTIFYFNTGTININANSGSTSPNGCTASVSTKVGSTGQMQYGVKCTAASLIPGNLPATLTGNLLMAPCTGPYGDPLLTTDPIGEQHGILFFGNRSANLSALGNQPAFGGGGTAAALGSLYFHYCNSPDGAGLGTNCPPTPATGATAAFTDNITLQGSSGSTSYVVGDIVTDELGLGGTPTIVMDLNPNALYYIYAATLLQ